MTDDLIDTVVDEYAPRDTAAADWDWGALEEAGVKQLNLRLQIPEEERVEMSTATLAELLHERVHALHQEREVAFTPPVMRQLEKFVLLQTIDQLWKEHLLNMDHLKEGISLRSYGQRQPLQEYQKEGFEMFEEMISAVHKDAVQKIFTVQAVRADDLQRLEQRRRPQPARMTMRGGGGAARQGQGRG